MSNWIKYGSYFVSAGLTITGVLWFANQTDPRVRGEDIADLFEAKQERKVIPYLTGETLPDWSDANSYGNAYPTNSIGDKILYKDVLNITDGIRDIILKDGTSIYWITTNLYHGIELSNMLGAWSVTNYPSGNFADIYGGGSGIEITNNVYTYSTNRYADTIITSASRSVTNTYPLRVPIDEGFYASVSQTNAPLSANIFNGAIGGAVVSSDYWTNGAFWPTEKLYAFSWEQWSDTNRSRVVARHDSGYNIKQWFTSAWVSTNSPSFSLPVPITTNVTGYCVSRFYDVAGHASTNFFYIKDAPTDNGLYCQPGFTSVEVGLNTEADVTFAATGIASSKYILPTTIYGTLPTVKTSVRSLGSFWRVIWNKSTTPKEGIVKLTAYDDALFQTASTNIQPIFFHLRISDTAWNGTNSYFIVNARAYNGATATGIATTNAIVTAFTRTDDQRITTNKLAETHTVLTNLFRTVWIGDGDSASYTGRTQTVYSHATTNYFADTDSGTGDYTPTYPSGYTLGDFYADFTNRVDETPTEYGANTGITFASFLFDLRETGEATVQENGDWLSSVTVDGTDSEVTVNAFKSVSLPYPSLYAITNGNVSAVSIYAIVEAANVTPHAYRIGGNYYSHSNSGETWYSGNLGVSSSELFVNVSTDVIDTAVEKYNLKSFEPTGLSSELQFCNRCQASLIWQTNNPTGPIVFDLPVQAITHSDANRTDYYFAQTAPSDTNRVENWQRKYYLSYDVRATKWLVVVDWSFKHLDNGFVPTTNNPSWKE